MAVNLDPGLHKQKKWREDATYSTDLGVLQYRGHSHKGAETEVCEDVYANMEIKTDQRSSSSKDSMDSYEEIYANDDVLEPSLTRSDKGTMTSGADNAMNRCYRLAAMCLVLLCVLLLVATTVLWVKFTGQNQLQTRYSNLNTEKDQLQTRYNNLNTEKDQLQTRYNNLNTEKDLLQTRYNNLNTEKEQLQTRFNNLNTGKDQLQTRYNSLNTEKDQLQTRFNNLNTEKDQLQKRYNNLNTEKNQLQTRLNNLNTEKNQLQTRLNNLNTEKDHLQTRYNNLNTEKDQLQTILQGATKKIQQIWNILDQYKTEWRYFHFSMYYISTETKTWDNSRQYCQNKNADLVTINSKEEQDFIEVLRGGQTAWIGLNDKAREEDWKWVDGTALSTRYWRDGEPNSKAGNEDCVVTGWGSDKVFSWADYPCSDQFVWVCEKRILN